MSWFRVTSTRINTVEDLTFLTFRQNTWHIPWACAGKGALSYPLTDEATLRPSHISGGIKAGALVFFISSQTDTWIRSLLHLVHQSLSLMRSCGRESAVYFAPQPIAAGERLSASDGLFCVIFKSACVESLMSSRWDRDSYACNESDFILTSCLSRPSGHIKWWMLRSQVAHA